MTKNKFFKITVLTSFLIISVLFNANAQVTIGSDTNPNATLDVVASKTDGTTAEGLIAPRLTGDQLKAADAQYGTPQNSTLVYVTVAVTTASPKTINVKEPGFYYYDAPNGIWVALHAGNNKWFYMPSFNLPLGTTIGAALTFNLYNEYAKQFQQSGNTQFVASTGAADPTKVVAPYAVTDLEFYVTAYSTDVITITGIDADGTLHYTPLAVTAPEGSFIDIIFKVK